MIDVLAVVAQNADVGTSELWGRGLAATLGTIIVAYLGYLGVKQKSKNDAKASLGEISQQELATTLGSMRSDITELRTRVDALEHENKLLETDNARLKAENRNKDDLIWSFTHWHIEGLEKWISDGCPSPPGKPGYPWQMRRHLNDARNPEGPHDTI